MSAFINEKFPVRYDLPCLQTIGREVGPVAHPPWFAGNTGLHAGRHAGHRKGMSPKKSRPWVPV